LISTSIPEIHCLAGLVVIVTVLAASVVLSVRRPLAVEADEPELVGAGEARDR